QLGYGNDSINVRIDSSIAKISLMVNEFGCWSDTVAKSVKRKPHFDFYTLDEKGCQPYLLEIFPETNDDSLEYTWIYDTLPNITSNPGVYYFSEPGEFNIEAIAFSNETQCSDTLVKKDWITVHPKPVAAFEVNYPVATIENPDITFSNLSGLAENYFWDFGDSFNSILENPQHSYSEIGEYNVNMIAESGFGCLDTTDFLIRIVPFSVFAPNAFRPDSDIPENRVFMPVGIGADPERFNIKIYTRWGTLVFESDNPEYKWDGKTLNGELAPMGNYIWKSKYYDIQGIEHNQNGYVILIR
ncbi:MAG: gliding motility-associated C-terminal domain-containing protein, partial [Prolixibacteraceae bacterium]|nr:gliding motility-associated C-terminal domain-containing protein [Prolixibacteraceae bacterium]